MKKLLILGGSSFIGRHFVERVVETKNYDITLFNRQQSHAELFPTVRKIRGDRNTDDIFQIGKEHWDIVVDFSCYLPNALKNTLEALKDKVDKYIFISTVSVYDLEIKSDGNLSESATILECTEQQAIDESWVGYGNKKAECDRMLIHSEVKHTILRPSIVYGAYDYTDRFYYWLHQVQTQKHIMVPENGANTLAITYVIDLVNSIQCAMEQTLPSNIYNIISDNEMSILKVVEGTQNVLAVKNQLVNASYGFLKEHEVNEWSDMPLWIHGGDFHFDNRRMLADFDMEIVDFESTMKQTIRWNIERRWPNPVAGISADRQQELLSLLLESK